jgi:hypothetical protein
MGVDWKNEDAVYFEGLVRDKFYDSEYPNVLNYSLQFGS